MSVTAESPDAVRERLEATVRDAVAFAKKANKEAALLVFNNASGQFAANGSYIFAFDMNGTTLAMPFEPAKVGRNESDLKDVNGVSIGERKLQLANEGGGFFYYVYTNPASGKPEFKVSYVQPVDTQWAVGAGTYLPDVVAIFPQDRRDQLVARVNEAAAYVQKNGREAAIATFNDPNGTFSQRDMYIFAFDRNGTELVSPFLQGMIGVNRLADRDQYGQYSVRYILDNAKKGGGFMYYFFADPSTDYQVRLKLTYAKQAGDDLVIGAGIYP
jgi:polar amino acid transport system substrate-binding protein